MLAHRRLGSGEPLLLLHGLGGCWQVWRPVLDAVAREREVIAADLPGFGQSAPLPAEVVPSPAALAREVAAFLDECGWQTAHVAGNSLGGWVALELAKLGRARSVIAISPGGFWSRPGLWFARGSLRASRWIARALRPVVEQAVGSKFGRTLLLSQMHARPWRVPAPDAALALRAFTDAPGFEATFRASLQRQGFRDDGSIRCPVTVAWGTRDRLLMPRQLARVRERLPEARLVSLEGCGHVPTWDDPERIGRLLLDRT